MWKPARAYKRIKNFESKALRKNWLCEAFLFLLNQFRAYERCRSDRPNSFLNTQNRCSKWWFLSFLHCTSAFQPWLRGTTFGQRGEFIFQVCAFFPPCVDCQQRRQLVHSLSIWSKWKQRQQNKGRDVFAPGILFWHLFWILARPTIVCIILRKKNTPSLITIGYDDGGNGLEKSWIFAVPYSGITKTRANSLLLCHSAIMFNNLIRKAVLLFPIIKAKTVHTSKTN